MQHINAKQQKNNRLISSKPVAIKQTNSVKNIIQPKLKIGALNDKYEREADRVADQVMRMPTPAQPSSTNSSQVLNNSNTPNIQRKCAGCAKEDELIQKKTSGATPEVTPTINSNIQSLQGGGQPLSKSERNFFEPRFGTDFSNVKIHTDSHANNTAKSINARAFTHGNNVFFGAGEYSTGSEGGKKLLAHELTHVVQQAGSQTSLAGGGGEKSRDSRARAPNITYQAKHSIQKSPLNCDQEQILCFRRCWREDPPWPIDKGKKGHYLYCQSKCLAEYMACIGQKVAERAFASMAAANEWLVNHPEIVVGTIVVVGGVTFIVATGGLGGLVLAPAAASDRRLKHSIKLIGVSHKGLNIYSFKYKDTKFGEGTWQGVMSDEIPDFAIIIGSDGFDRVNYSKLDVCFTRIK